MWWLFLYLLNKGNQFYSSFTIFAEWFFPPVSAVEGIKSFPSVCVCVRGFTQGTLYTTTTVYGVLVHQEGAICTIRAQYAPWCTRETMFFEKFRGPWWFFYCITYVDCTEPFCHDTWRHVISQRDVMTSRDVTAWRLEPFNDFWARVLTRRARRGRACQRSGVFIGQYLHNEMS